MSKAFGRTGQPLRFPLKAGTPELVTVTLPPNVKTFMMVNTSGYDARLEGVSQADSNTPVTETTGWVIMARTVMGPFTTKNPMRISVIPISTHGNPLPANPDFTDAWIELQYGEDN